MITRRQFIKGAAAVGIGMALPLKFGVRGAYAFAQSPGLTKFIDPLPGLGPAGIPVATSDGVSPLGAAHYSITAGQFRQVLHSDFLNPLKPAYISTTWPGTVLWGYASTAAVDLVGGQPNFRHLGGVIVAAGGNNGVGAVPVQITFTNRLPLKHPLPVDTTIPGANVQQNRMATHIHGGHVPWIADGGPHDWFDPSGNSGLSFPNGPGSVLDPTNILVPGQASYYYPNDQSARLVWYHDHAWGITRINAHIGVASAYLITDAVEASLIGTGGALAGMGVGTPLVFQDKIFVPNNINIVDPTWVNVVPDPSPGNLWYAHVYDPTRWKLFTGKGTLPPPDPSAIPEYFGDTMLVNGHVYPFTEVPQQRVRFRLLNACNARFLNLQLFLDNGTTDSITINPRTLRPTNAAGPPMVQIGTEGGFLPSPVVFNPPTTPFNPKLFNGTLVLAPAERADLIIDFSVLPAGTKVILYSDAPAPFPVGDPRNDYFPGAPKNPTITTPGYGPNTRQMIRFVVTGNAVPPGTVAGFNSYVTNVLTPAIQAAFTASQPALPVTGPTVIGGVTQLPTGPMVVAAPRQLTLNEDFDAYGRLIQREGTNVSIYKGTFGRNYMDLQTENVTNGTTEVWQIANLTGDTHPIHFHLINAQILSRQPFNVKNYAGVPSFTGPARPPDANELGWKETIRMNPGEVITLAMPFALPTGLPFAVPASTRTGGNEYVWHCHILEHEEHDMMRPLVVF